MSDAQETTRRRTMLVTGGGRGIGAAICTRAVQRGYRVAINYLQDQSSATSLCDELNAIAPADSEGKAAYCLQADVSDEQDILTLFAQCDEHFDRLDVLVNNAGIVDRSIRFDDVTRSRIERLLSTNVTGPMLCAREAIKRMSHRHGGNGGAIVNLSSVAALIGSPREYIDYAASKGAIDTFTLGLANEMATEGVRVNAVRPGIIDTGIHASGGEPDRIARIAPRIPMGRAGTALEVANAVLWLASDEASYVTGSFINVSGGR